MIEEEQKPKSLLGAFRKLGGYYPERTTIVALEIGTSVGKKKFEFVKFWEIFQS